MLRVLALAACLWRSALPEPTEDRCAAPEACQTLASEPSGVHHLFATTIYVADTQLPPAVLAEAGRVVLERHDAWRASPDAPARAAEANDAFFDAQAAWTRAWLAAYGACGGAAADCEAVAAAANGTWAASLPSESAAFSAIWAAVGAHARRFVAAAGFAGVDLRANQIFNPTSM